MDKGAIKNFAIEARKTLMKSAITEAGFYGITKDGCKKPIQKGSDFEVYETLAGTENRIYGNDIIRRANLAKAVQEQGFVQVIEETVYTWFNRIIAIRFMEVNDYLPTRVSVLSSETGSNTPDIVTQSLDVDLNMTPEELENVQTAKANNKYDEAFRLLFIKQCNELNDILPGLFEKTDDYMELLLKLSYINDGVVRILVDTIPEENFDVEKEGQVEIIGWLYQYYNTELKDDTFAKLKKNIKITKERIPAATQLFTPDWIVRYMVENSVGRLWIEHLKVNDPMLDEKAKAEEFGWKYYTDAAEQDLDVISHLAKINDELINLSPQDLSCIDPCMGSGHILVYIFDLLMDIYRSEGFNEREAVFEILEHNIYGLDIDRRAYQLTYFAIMMRARKYNRRFFLGKVKENNVKIKSAPNIYDIEESNMIDTSLFNLFKGSNENKKALEELIQLVEEFHNAKEYGSILNISNLDWNKLREIVNSGNSEIQLSLNSIEFEKLRKKLLRLINIGEVMARKYLITVTNPPYMGNMPVLMTDYVREHYSISKYDLYSVFMQKCNEFTKTNGMVSLITQHTWMFISSFEEFRKEISKHIIVNILHLGTRAFEAISGEVVQTVAFVLKKNTVANYKVKAERLVDYPDENSKEKAYLENKSCYTIYQNYFKLLPGNQFVYWLSKQYFDALKKGNKLECYVERKAGVVTGNDDYFLKMWFEINYEDISFYGKQQDEYSKYHIMSKGGGFRRYYGNFVFVIKLEELWDPSKTNASVRRGDADYYFKQAIGWSQVGNAQKSFRYIEHSVCGTATPTIYFNDEKYYKYTLAFLNSKIAFNYLTAFNPTINLLTTDICNLPLLLDKNNFDRISMLCEENILISKKDWDSFETSWDFCKSPLVPSETNKNILLKDYYGFWNEIVESRFITLKNNEEKINELFINLYGLENEVYPLIDDSDISIRKADMRRDIRNLISYAVGCMFGRYSLDIDGIVYAGGEWDPNQYKSYVPDSDGIIPITDEDYFNDDILERFVEFVKVVYGDKYLEENLEFIAEVLGNKGSSSREVIRNYFLKDFYKDHCNMYSVTGSGKRPIYWLFDSGKQNGFKALIYMHRYNKDTVGVIRSKYLIRTQEAIQRALQNTEYIISSATSAVDSAKATKARDKYIKQLNEIKTYYQALSHVALQRIERDLDDGVKANYAKFQGIEVSNEGIKKQTIDLLAKI